MVIGRIKKVLGVTLLTGINAAAIRCESNYGAGYTVKFLWSPDSI